MLSFVFFSMPITFPRLLFGTHGVYIFFFLVTVSLGSPCFIPYNFNLLSTDGCCGISGDGFCTCHLFGFLLWFCPAKHCSLGNAQGLVLAFFIWYLVSRWRLFRRTREEAWSWCENILCTSPRCAPLSPVHTRSCLLMQTIVLFVSFIHLLCDSF